MANILASVIIDAAAVPLHDTAHTRWTVATQLNALMDGEKAIVLLKPDAYVTRTAFILQAGVQQGIPSGGVCFLSSPRNMGTDGTTPGASIAVFPKDELDTHNPDWPTDTASATVNAALYDPSDPKSFYCYPQQPSSGFGYIQWPYSTIPPAIANEGSSINLDDIYKEPLIQWLIYKAYARDKEDAANHALSQDAKNEFYRLLGIKDQKEATEVK